MSDYDDIPPIVIDNGTYMMKAGYGGDDSPRAVFPTILGKPKVNSVIYGMNQRARYIGDDAQSKRGILNINKPIKNGIIEDWDNIEHIWHYTFETELRIAPEEHPILLTEHPLNPKQNREKTTQIMFETFNIRAFYLESSSNLSLYAASGKTEGLVLHCGESSSFALPIFEKKKKMK